jgi:VWFA-related protein
MLKRRMFARVLGVSLLVVAALALPSAQQPAPAPDQEAGTAPAQPTPTFRGGIDFVRVDAFVTDKKGNPVTDLKESDFEVVEDGKPQTVEQFKTIRIDGTPALDEPVREIRGSAAEESEAQRDDVRLFVFFLDDYHTRDRNAIAIRKTLTEFVQRLGPLDMMAIMYPLMSAQDVTFTRNQDSIIGAFEHFEGRKYDYTPRNEYERIYDRLSTPDIERLRNHIVQGALEGLAIRLGGLRDGRKSVIFVSEGFTVSLPPEMRRQNSQAPQFTSAPRDEQFEQDAETQGRLDLDVRMKEVYRAAHRFNTAFYSLDPRGLSPFEFDINDGSVGGVSAASDRATFRAAQETLQSLSEETDGRAILNRNSLLDGLTQAIRDSSFYYLLGYTTQSKHDGKFHEIKVRVKRSGVDVRARKGYWAFTNEMVTRMNAPKTPDAPTPITQALAKLASPVQAARYTRMWVGTEQGTNGKTRVSIVWEPLPAPAGARKEQAGRVSVLAATDKGDLVFRGRSPDGAAATTPAAPQASITGTASAPQRITFEAPPGKLDLRMTIEATGGGTIDTDNRSITVPDLTTPVAALSTPRVFRARSARDFTILAQDANAVPVATREFSRTERLLIRFDVYGANGDKPLPTAAMLGVDGHKILDIPVAPAQAGGTHQVDLGLNTVAAGDYVLEITVTGTSGDPVKEYVPFRIGA